MAENAGGRSRPAGTHTQRRHTHTLEHWTDSDFLSQHLIAACT